MQKFLLTGFLAVLFMALAPSVASAACVKTIDDTGIQTQTLYAGQSIDAGTVSLQVSGDNLVVTYNTTGGWELTETHLWVGKSLADMPQTKKGNPKVGNFPYNSGDITSATTFSFTVALSSFGFIQNADGTCEDQLFFAAAHAALRKPDGNGGYQTETGWGNGESMVVKGNWATYFSSTITCDCGGGGGGGETCETMFGYGGSYAACFIDLGLGIERWGWTNGPLAASTDMYTFDLYAGAGQCDLSKGTKVGTVFVIYDGYTAVVTYSMDSGYTMSETHMYVGSEILPRDNQGEYTIAPGQFPYKHDLNDAVTDTFVVGGLSGDMQVVAHGVVCWQE